MMILTMTIMIMEHVQIFYSFFELFKAKLQYLQEQADLTWPQNKSTK